MRSTEAETTEFECPVSSTGTLGLKPYGVKCGSFLRRVLFPMRRSTPIMTNYTRQ